MLWLVALTGLAALAQSEELQGVKDQRKPFAVLGFEVNVMNRTMVEDRGGAAVHAGDVMLVPPQRSEEGFAAGQMPAADQSPLLELAQVPVNRRQSHGAVAAPQLGMQLLSRQFLLGVLQVLNDQLLPLRDAGNLGGHARPVWMGSRSYG